MSAAFLMVTAAIFAAAQVADLTDMADGPMMSLSSLLLVSREWLIVFLLVALLAPPAMLAGVVSRPYWWAPALAPFVGGFAAWCLMIAQGIMFAGGLAGAYEQVQEDVPFLLGCHLGGTLVALAFGSLGTRLSGREVPRCLIIGLATPASALVFALGAANPAIWRDTVIAPWAALVGLQAGLLVAFLVAYWTPRTERRWLLASAGVSWLAAGVATGLLSWRFASSDSLSLAIYWATAAGAGAGLTFLALLAVVGQHWRIAGRVAFPRIVLGVALLSLGCLWVAARQPPGEGVIGRFAPSPESMRRDPSLGTDTRSHVEFRGAEMRIAPKAPNIIAEIAWGADGGPLVAYVGPPEGGEQGSFVLLSLVGQKPRRIALSDGRARQLDACATGRGFVFRYLPTVTRQEAERLGFRWSNDDLRTVQEYGLLGSDIGHWESGATTTPMFLGLSGHNGPPDCSPISSEIAFFHLSPFDEERIEDGMWVEDGIWVVDLDSGERRTITRRQINPTSHQVDEGPRWSPDGRGIAFMRIVYETSGYHRDLWLANADGSVERQLTVVGDLAGKHFVWSEDGNRVAFLRASGRPLFSAPLSLWSVELSSGHLQEILSWERLLCPKYADDILPSPGFSQVAVRLARQGGRARQLWVIDSASAVLTRVDSADDIGALAWSPDGAMLAYVRDEREVWIADKAAAWHSRRVWRQP